MWAVGAGALSLVALVGLVLGAVALALAVQNNRAAASHTDDPPQQRLAWLPFPTASGNENGRV